MAAVTQWQSLELRSVGFTSQLAKCCWVYHLTSLCLNFHICKMELIIVLISLPLISYDSIAFNMGFFFIFFFTTLLRNSLLKHTKWYVLTECNLMSFDM